MALLIYQGEGVSEQEKEKTQLSTMLTTKVSEFVVRGFKSPYEEQWKTMGHMIMKL